MHIQMTSFFSKFRNSKLFDFFFDMSDFGILEHGNRRFCAGFFTTLVGLSYYATENSIKYKHGKQNASFLSELDLRKKEDRSLKFLAMSAFSAMVVSRLHVHHQ